MASLLNVEVPERELEAIRDLVKSGIYPLVTVPYTASPTELQAEAFKKRGEVLRDAEARLSKLLGSEDGNGKEPEQ